MEILKGQVQWNGRDDILCTYGKMEDGRQYYFIQELTNGNVIVSTALIEAIDPMSKAKNIGLIDKDGKEIIPCTNSSIKVLSDDVLLVEPAEAVSDNVKEANSLRMDPLSATRLVSTPAQIKEKINAKMSPEGRYVLNDQFKDGTLDDANGVNLVNGEYYSFVAVDNDKIFMAKNFPETDVVEFSIADKKIVEEAKEEVIEAPVEEVTEPVQEVAPAEEVTTEPGEIVTEQVQEAAPVEEVKPVENVNEGFAKEDIDLGQEISIPAVDTVAETPIQNNIPTSNSFMDLITDPNATNSVEKESFDEIKEEEPTTEINNDEVVAEVEEKELTDEDMDNRESDIERRLNELNEKFNSMNEQFSKIETKEETPVEDTVDAKDMDEEAEEENVFTSPEVDNIDSFEEENEDYEAMEDIEDDVKDTTMEDATKAIDALAQKYNEKVVELTDALEREEKLKNSRKNYIEKSKAQEQKISLLTAKNHDLIDANSKLEAKIESLNIAADLQKRKNEEQKRRIGELERENMRLSTQVEGKEELARALESVRALIGENDNYSEDNSYYRKAA